MSQLRSIFQIQMKIYGNLFYFTFNLLFIIYANFNFEIIQIRNIFFHIQWNSWLGSLKIDMSSLFQKKDINKAIKVEERQTSSMKELFCTIFMGNKVNKKNLKNIRSYIRLVLFSLFFMYHMHINCNKIHIIHKNINEIQIHLIW